MHPLHNSASTAPKRFTSLALWYILTTRLRAPGLPPMPVLDAPATSAAVPLADEELHLVFDALDALLSSTDPATRSWLAETLGPSTFRQRTEALHSRFAAYLN